MYFIGFSERVFILHDGAAGFDIKFSQNSIDCFAAISPFLLHSCSLKVFCFSPQDQPTLLLGDLFFINLLLLITNDCTADLKKILCEAAVTCVQLSTSSWEPICIDEFR